MCKLSQYVRPCIISASFGMTLLTALPSLAESVVVVSIAGEAYDGPPSFNLLIGDKVVGSGTLTKAIATDVDGRLFTKPRPGSFLEEFSFTIPDGLLKPDSELGLVLTNDKFVEREGEGEDGILDRNLFVDFVRVNEVEVTSADMILIHNGDEVRENYQAGFLPIYKAGYRAVVRPPEGGWLAETDQKVGQLGMAVIPMPLPRPARLLYAAEVQP